ncbi:MAG: NADH-quinone oxidoreductase subunit L [Candidatus Wallbacteria bacterium]|nr:NADH-quinone oxidoreductase subunit L [Candidatus Wallbacteria bacterium]
MGLETLIALVVLLPLAGAALNGFFGQLHGKRLSGYLACAVMAASFACAASAVAGLSGLSPASRSVTSVLYTWMDASSLRVEMAFTLDPLSGVMILVVTGVGFLIHVYSLGYMAHDDGRVRYFSYLNLFVFFMLVLVLGASMPVMFLGWEGVGLCSYLLIGFWFEDAAKATAGKKAFLTNRVGDMFFALGMFSLFWATYQAGSGTLAFAGLKANKHLIEQATVGAVPLATFAALCLFIGATGKSAQIPLYVWLPDAMAGPTPVSALIHAATMVTAGVYMVARMSWLYQMAPGVMELVAWIGALTALFAAAIGLAATDIKKVLAYSTISQLGYMFLGVGVGGYVAGIFHLVTHAFFKGLLFLGAGSVIHGCHGNQDIRKMGGLKDKMPWTFWTFLVATWAIAGLPPFAGFVSKDEILYEAYNSPHGSLALWLAGVVAAVMTAFYMFRLFTLTFLGAPRMGKKDFDHVHESPAVMTVPLAVLAGLSAVGGALNLPGGIAHALHLPRVLSDWLAPVFPVEATAHASNEWALMGASVLVALAGTLGALHVYYRQKTVPVADNARLTVPVRMARDKFYVDEAYDILIVKPVRGLGRFLAGPIDKRVIDRVLAELPPAVAYWLSARVTSLQNGNVQAYAVVLFGGTVAILAYLTLYLR